jgi:branched-chain amino acid transport system permease protein
MTIELFVLQFLNGVAVGLLYALTAFGLSLIKGLLNIPNFAHGAFYMLGAYVTFKIVQQTGSFTLGLVASAIVPAVVGMIVERFGIRRLYGPAYLFQLLFLFGAALIIQETAILIWGGTGGSIAPPALLEGAVTIGDMSMPRYLIFAAAASAAVITLIWLIIEQTRYGSIIRAGMEHQHMVAALGINVGLLFTVCFGLGAALAGLAGGLSAPLVGLSATMGSDILALAFVIVVLGGLGSLYGAIVAGVIVGIVQSVSALWVPEASTVLIYVMMILILLVRPQGLLGER